MRERLERALFVCVPLSGEEMATEGKPITMGGVWLPIIRFFFQVSSKPVEKILMVLLALGAVASFAASWSQALQEKILLFNQTLVSGICVAIPIVLCDRDLLVLPFAFHRIAFIHLLALIELPAVTLLFLCYLKNGEVVLYRKRMDTFSLFIVIPCVILYFWGYLFYLPPTRTVFGPLASGLFSILVFDLYKRVIASLIFRDRSLVVKTPNPPK